METQAIQPRVLRMHLTSPVLVKDGHRIERYLCGKVIVERKPEEPTELLCARTQEEVTKAMGSGFKVAMAQ